MKILLVEDDINLAEALVKSLHNEGYATNHVNNGSDALLSIKTQDCDMVVLDLGLPDIDGTEVLRHIRKQKNPIPILVLTARDTIEDKIQGLDFGADDYLPKPFEVKELFARLRVIERRLGTVNTSIIEVANVVLDIASHKITCDDEVIECSRKEFMVLKSLMENTGRIQSREQLEHNLYQWGEEVASNAVEVHIHHLRKKLPKNFIKTIRGVGYRVG
ncbi:MAG: DNA-binding response OmpR family regulator [Psychrosphaera sp.]|jgi:DNA-binding response OmpR family regulator